jgi:hypothetical protein
MHTPPLRLVVSNSERPNCETPCSKSLTTSSISSVTELSTLIEELQELAYLKPQYLGGIAVLVRDQLRRQRIEHPTAAAKYQRLGRPGVDGVTVDITG